MRAKGFRGCAPFGTRARSGAWSTLPTSRGERLSGQACFVVRLPKRSPGFSCPSGLVCSVIDDEARLDDRKDNR